MYYLSPAGSVIDTQRHQLWAKFPWITVTRSDQASRARSQPLPCARHSTYLMLTNLLEVDIFYVLLTVDRARPQTVPLSETELILLPGIRPVYDTFLYIV